MNLSSPPDSRWLPFMKMTFGFVLLVVLAILAVVIALGKVEQSTSFGLSYILGGLTAMTGGFVQWSFGSGRNESKEPEAK